MRTVHFARLLTTAGLLALAPAALAGTLTLAGETSGTSAVTHSCPTPVAHTCRDSLNPDPISLLTGASQGAQTALSTYFDDWTFTYNFAQPWGGTLTIDDYDAVDFGVGDAKHDPGCITDPPTKWNGMGAHLKAHFTPDDPSAIHRFRWIQIIFTSDPAGGLDPWTPYVDPWGNPPEDDLPFYFKEDEWTAWGLPSEYWFDDWPRRTCPCLGTVNWRAELYLVDWYEKPAGAAEDTFVLVTGGVRWGFDIVCVPLPPAVALGLALLALSGMAGAGRRRR